MADGNGTHTELKRAWAHFLERRAWNHVATLTTRHERSSAVLVRTFENTFLRTLARMAQRRIRWFAVVEGGFDDDSRTHIHALLSGTELLRTKQIESAWPFGFTRITSYSQSEGIELYVSKSLAKATESWRMSRSLPPKEAFSDLSHPKKGRKQR